jgi:hypothetical protein
MKTIIIDYTHFSTKAYIEFDGKYFNVHIPEFDIFYSTQTSENIVERGHDMIEVFYYS